jgi:hypothetical protein
LPLHSTRTVALDGVMRSTESLIARVSAPRTLQWWVTEPNADFVFLRASERRACESCEQCDSEGCAQRQL